MSWASMTLLKTEKHGENENVQATFGSLSLEPTKFSTVFSRKF